LRSELVVAQNYLDRLNNALEKTTTDSVKTELKTQIDELAKIKSETENFCEEYGWKV